MTQNIGYARVNAEGMIHGYQRTPTLEEAQRIAKLQNEHNELFAIPDDRWITVVVSEYKAPPTPEERAKARRIRDSFTLNVEIGEKVTVARGEHAGKRVRVCGLMPGLRYVVCLLDDGGYFIRNSKRVIIPKADLEP